MVDNIELLKKYMNFSNPEKFYYLQILRRKKENKNAKSVKTIQNFFIQNEEYFDRKIEPIKELCDYFNARAYLRMNRRSYKDVAYEMNVRLAKSLKHEQYNHVSSIFSKACGNVCSEDNKIWVIDLDGDECLLLNEVKEYIGKLHSEVRNNNYKIITDVPTKNGIHILSNPFNSKKFSDKYDSIHIHKDNPTLMYCP